MNWGFNPQPPGNFNPECVGIWEKRCNSLLKMKSPVHMRRVTTDWCPTQTNNWRPSTTLQRRTVLSADAVTTESSQKAMQVMRPPWPPSSSSGSHGWSPTRGDHTRTKPSWPPVARSVESSLTLRHSTRPLCASTTCSSLPSDTADLDSDTPILPLRFSLYHDHPFSVWR